jgi:alkylglycerol monooxygenase
MAISYAQAVSFAIPVFVGMIAVEFIADRVQHRGQYRLADSINSLSCGMVNTGIKIFFGFIGLFFYQWVLRNLAPVQLPASHWGTWLFTFFAYDLCYYWQHRCGHTVGLFWAAHVVHHQSEEFNLTTALRQTGTGAFVDWVFYLPLVLCGVPILVVAGVGVVQLFYQFWPHTQKIGRMGVLDRWIQTPSNHRVHHAQNDIYVDRNYVGVFAIWDRMFGTFQEELDAEPCIYGIRGQLKSWNPLWANFHYWWVMLRDCWYARSWADKVRVWFAPPGWRPADVAARFPKPAYDPKRDFVKYDPPRPLGLSIYCGIQFLVLMAANSHFLAAPPSAYYFLFLLASLVSVGGVMEGRREFVMAEGVRLAAVAAGVWWTGQWFGGSQSALLVNGIAAFAIASLLGLWAAVRMGGEPARQLA